MRVLIACEFSGVVREAFAARGHDAWSCDLLDTEIPGNHIKGDVFEILDDGWDMMIAHPPCTHLSSSGAQYWAQKRKTGEQYMAIGFFMFLFSAPIRKICIENPVGLMSTILKKPDQIIHPYQFGDPYLKKTCFWLKGISPLAHTNIVEPIAHWHGGSRRSGPNNNGERTPCKLPTALKYGWKERSRTFPGIANAMAEQWCG